MALPTFIKQPTEVLDYDVDFSEWLPAGDTIDSVVVTADAGITLNSTSFGVDEVKQWLSGGTAGEIYKITARITTAAGRVKEQEFRIRVKEI